MATDFFSGLHPNTRGIYTRHPQYKEVFDAIIERNGELLKAEPAAGGHHIKFREVGTKDFHSVTVTPKTIAAAKKTAKAYLPASREIAGRKPKQARGHVPTRSYVPAPRGTAAAPVGTA